MTAHGLAQDPSLPMWTRWVFRLQLLLIVAAIGTYSYVATRIRPLLAESAELRQHVRADSITSDSLRRVLESSRKALLNTRSGIEAYHRGAYDAAVEGYDAALTQQPNDAYVLNLKGYSLFKAGKFDAALAALHQSVQANPSYAWGYFDLARVQCKVGQASAAEASIRQALRDPAMVGRMQGDAEFRHLCGEVMARMGVPQWR